MDLGMRFRSAFFMCIILVCMTAGTFLLLNLLDDSSLDYYQFVINGNDYFVHDMVSLGESILPHFPQPVLVEIYNPERVLVDSFHLLPGDLDPPGQIGLLGRLERNSIYCRLRMYSEPDALDLFIRRIESELLVWVGYASEALNLGS